MAGVTSVPDAAAEFEHAAQLASTSQVAEQRHVGRWIAGAVCLFLFAFAINSVATNRAIGWHVIGRYFTAHAILSGLYLTLWLTAVVDVLAFIIGTVLAAMRMSHNPILRLLSWIYTWIFRSIPLLVQLLLWFNIGYLYPHVSLGIPFGPTFGSLISEAAQVHQDEGELERGLSAATRSSAAACAAAARNLLHGSNAPASRAASKAALA